jgi:tRNA threonylcarbamoyladenosine biosynthesis protein TsaB
MIIALKTADNTTRFWLFAGLDAAEPTAHIEWESGRDLSDQLLQRLTDFVESHDTQLTALTGIAVYSGPGSFTSLRIGHSVANALADSLGIPVVGATGEGWLASAQASLRTANPGRPALPHYGAEAHITRPKS